MIDKVISVILKSLPFFMASIFCSCFEDDEAVSPYKGHVVTIADNIEEYQSYYDFETDNTVATFATDLWQLGFESDSKGWHIMVNSGANWFIWNSFQQDLEAPLSLPSDEWWSYDIQSAYPDSTSVGTWTIQTDNQQREYTNHVYVLAKYSDGEYLPQLRIKFLYVDSICYQFCFRSEVNSNTDTVDIIKTDSVSFVYYDLFENLQRNLEPTQEAYDIVFCSYYDLATQFGITIPYLVRGVFLNLENTTAVLDSMSGYDQIDYEVLGNYTFSSQRDLIGYRWKDVDVNVSAGSANYSIQHHYTYVIKTGEEKFYKMRFLSFSLDGISGFPQFEYKALMAVE
jgi:hypothetical protein